MTKSQKTLCNIGIVVLLFAFWVAESIRELTNYLPRTTPLLIVLGLCCISAAVFGLKWALSRRGDGKLGWGWFVALWILVAVLFVIVFPRAQAKTDPNRNDSYDALLVSSTELLHGHYPYYVHDVYGHLDTHMPGALFLGLPFLILGRESLQNLFWLGIFMWFTTRYFRFRITAFAFLLIVVLGSAHTLPNILDGADYPTNWMYISVGIFLFLGSIEHGSGWKFVASSLLLGTAYSVRPNYVLVTSPLLLAYLMQRIGAVAALRRMALPLAVTLAITAPFYLYDPSHFDPFHITDHVGFLPPHFQHPMVILLIVSAVAAACIGFFVRLTLPRFFLLAGVGTAVLIVTPALMMAMWAASEKLNLLGYSDAAGCFLSLWAFRCLEDQFAAVNGQHVSSQQSNSSLAPPCTKPA